MKIDVMNKYLTFTALFAAFFLSGCLKDDCEQIYRYIALNPVYKAGKEFRVSEISSTINRELVHPGKIYFYKNYLLINEQREGIHVYDNSDQSHPVKITFWEIPGNVDIEIRDDILMADSYTDLLFISIKDIYQPKLRTRLQETFNLYGSDGSGNYLVYYLPSHEVTVSECTNIQAGQPWIRLANGQLLAGREFFDTRVDLSSVNASSVSKALSNVGIGGSLARFTQYDQFLYILNEYKLSVFDLSNMDKPFLANDIPFGRGLETIFPYKDKLFIGSRSGMFIFDASTPSNPTMLSAFTHANACDPVYVDDQTAYVTLRDGTTCETFHNQLDVVDISNLSLPVLIKSYPMEHPHGLSKYKNNLYICEGNYGLKAFDASDHKSIDQNLLVHNKDIQAMDIITLPNETALVIGSDGFYQFDISNPKKLRELSRIPVVNN